MKNATFWLFWHSRRPKPAEKPRKACPGPLPGAQSLAGNSPGLLRACPGPPLACRGAPQRLPRVASGHPKACQGARQDLARPAPGRSSLAEELRKAFSRPPMDCRAAPAPKSCPGASGLDSQTLPRDGCSKSQLHSATSDNAEKASEHARVHSRRPCPMFRPVAASRSGTRYILRGN